MFASFFPQQTQKCQQNVLHWQMHPKEVSFISFYIRELCFYDGLSFERHAKFCLKVYDVCSERFYNPSISILIVKKKKKKLTTNRFSFFRTHIPRLMRNHKNKSISRVIFHCKIHLKESHWFVDPEDVSTVCKGLIWPKVGHRLGLDS